MTNPMHPCSDHSGEGPSILDLPLPGQLKQQWLELATRRQFLGRAGKALAWAGLARLMSDNTALASSGGDPGLLLPHFAPKAKRAIYLFMAGAPSQFETWDYKPELAKRFDQDLPESVRGGQVLTGMTASQSRLAIAPSLFNFQRHGAAGHWVSELFPHIAKVSDEFAVLKSLHTDAINHEPAILLINSGVALRSGGDPVIHLSNPKGVSRELRRAMIDGVNDMNRQLHDRIGDPETNARIARYEMAFRMQASVPELTDLKQRGLLDDTLVIWGGEFGRTVYSQGGLSKDNYGRDHHPRCFSMWMAGGGVKPGAVYGETDEFSYNIVKDPMHIRDLNATILHLLGVDHERLIFKFQGLDQRLTGVEPSKVVKEILA